VSSKVVYGYVWVGSKVARNVRGTTKQQGTIRNVWRGKLSVANHVICSKFRQCRNAAIPVLRSCLTAKPRLYSVPRSTFHFSATIFILLQVHLSLVLGNLYSGRSTLDQSLLIQLGSELHHLSTNQTLRFHVCRSLIHIASRCCHPHVPINTLDNSGYGCMIASFLCLFLYYYGHSDFLWSTILAVIFISPT
jgi:hypothetical protein